MKRLTVILAVLLVMTSVCSAAADAGDYMFGIAGALINRLAEEMNAQPEGEGVKEASVYTECGTLELVTGSAYLFNDHSAEGYVFAEMKNTGAQPLQIEKLSLICRDEKGKAISEEKYATYAPQMVPPGGSFFVKEWMYDFVRDAHRVDSVELVCSTRENPYRRVQEYPHVKAWIEEDYLYVQADNPADTPVLNLELVCVLRGADGSVLDMIRYVTGSNVGAGAQGSIVCRGPLERFIDDAAREAAKIETYGYVYSNGN